MLPGVSKTALLTLRARVDEHARPDRILIDPVAAEWWTHVQWPAELDAWYAAQWGLAFRADDLDQILTAYARLHPVAVVAELGAGLSTRRARLAAALGAVRWLDVDLPEVITLRRAWGAGGEAVAASVLDDAWLSALGAVDPRTLVLVMEGLLYYLPRRAVDALFERLRHHVPGALVLMDVLGEGDFAALHAHTRAVGAPIAWAHAAPLDDALPAFGLEPVEGFEPDVLTDAMLRRYWHRFDRRTLGAIVLARPLPSWARRSGVVLGRLRA